MALNVPEAFYTDRDSNEEETIVIELVFDSFFAEDEIRQRVRDALPDTETEVEAVFDAAGDYFFFVTLPGTNAAGAESEVFAFARRMRAELSAREANPVLTDSIYGTVAVGGAEESMLFSCETEKDMQLPYGWVHPLIHTIGAWQHSKGAGTTVALIDTGYSDHSELAGTLRQGGHANFVEGGGDARDRFNTGFLKNPGHGTLVMSVVASRGDADSHGGTQGPGAVTGSAPEAQILPIRAIRSVISFRQKTIPKAISHAFAQGADVIVMALGGPTRVASTERALRLAVENGLVVCCAAGNCWPSVVFPAAYATSGLCTAVAALTKDLTPWRKSGRGPEVTIAAPGENVWGAVKRSQDAVNHGITPAQGTTLATSLTTGVAACWVARHGGRGNLKTHADRLGTTVQTLWNACVTHGIQKPPVWNGATDLGAGLINAEKAMSAPLPQAAPEAVAGTLTDAGVESTANILLTHLANHAPEAVQEFDETISDYAAELLWLRYRAGARARAEESLEAPMTDDMISPDLAEALASKPLLKAAVSRR